MTSKLFRNHSPDTMLYRLRPSQKLRITSRDGQFLRISSLLVYPWMLITNRRIWELECSVTSLQSKIQVLLAVGNCFSATRMLKYQVCHNVFILPSRHQVQAWRFYANRVVYLPQKPKIISTSTCNLTWIWWVPANSKNWSYKDKFKLEITVHAKLSPFQMLEFWVLLWTSGKR